MVRRLMVPKESGVARRYPKGFEDEVAAEAAADRQVRTAVRTEERPRGYGRGAPRWRILPLNSSLNLSTSFFLQSCSLFRFLCHPE
jgi:hypothetical protein